MPVTADGCTIILPTYNRRHVLERTIGHYLALPASLLVIDDGSTDGTEPWLRSLGIEVLAHKGRRGLAAARNSGLRAARTDWIIFGEDDVLFEPGYIAALSDEAARLPRCGAVAGLLFTGTDWNPPLVRPPWEGRRPLDPDLLLGNFSCPLDRAVCMPSVHACGLIDRRLALAVGGYDEAYTDSAFREESDFYARLWRNGRSVWLTPVTWATHVRHRLGGGCRGRSGMIAKGFNRVSYWRNNARYVDRHGRMWRTWMEVPSQPRLKWNMLLRIAAQQIKAVWT